MSSQRLEKSFAPSGCQLREQISARKWQILEWTEKPRKLMKAPLPFTRREASSHGVTRHMLLNNSRYVQVTHGVWIDDEPETDIIAPIWADESWSKQQVALSAMLCADARVVGCNVTAAKLYGLPLPWRAGVDLHVALGRGASTKRRAGVVAHRYDRLQSCDFFGLPLVSVPQLFAELAGVLSVEELVVLGDAAVGRWHCGPLTRIEAIRAELASRSRLVGRRAAEQAVDLIREDVDSPPETRLRLRLMAAGLPEPVVHPAVPCPLIGAVLHPDLGYPEVRLAIEYEGDFHRSSPEQFAEDHRRAAALEAAGWTVLKVMKDSNRAEICRLVEHHLRRGGFL